MTVLSAFFGVCINSQPKKPMLLSKLRLRVITQREMVDFEAVDLEPGRVATQTDKAVCYKHPELGEQWPPKSQMRRDGAGNIYMKPWLKNKLEL